MKTSKKINLLQHAIRKQEKMNRVLTTIVQLFLVLGTLAVLRLMWQDLKHDLIEIKNDLRKQK
jgi:hypothetical protein